MVCKKRNYKSSWPFIGIKLWKKYWVIVAAKQLWINIKSIRFINGGNVLHSNIKNKTLIWEWRKMFHDKLISLVFIIYVQDSRNKKLKWEWLKISYEDVIYLVFITWIYLIGAILL